MESAALTRVRREEVEKKRPPLDLVLGVPRRVRPGVAASLKVHKDKKLDQARIDGIFRGSFRGLADKLVKGKGVTW